MKIAFVGKGGSGKTTLASTLCRYLAQQKLPVIAIDADINQHLGQSFGLSQSESEAIPALGLEMDKIKEYLAGENSRIKDPLQMVKTTPPGSGSALLRFEKNNPLYQHFMKEVDGIKLMAVGPFTQDDLGIKCYHAKTGAVELILNHFIDKKNEYIVVDMTAGADSFASGLFTRFDLTVLVVEPTLKSVSVYKQYKDYAKEYDINIKVVGNKIEGDDDIEFIKSHVGTDLLATFSHSQFIKAMEKGQTKPLSELEEHNHNALESIQKHVNSQEKDWDHYLKQAIFFHKKNADSWASDAAGFDLTEQIDPGFSLQQAAETI